MGTIDLRGDGVNTEMETGSRSTAAPIVAHRASWSEKFRGTPLTEANQAIQAYAWTVGQLRYAQLPHSPTTQPQPDISFATESGHLHLLLTHALCHIARQFQTETLPKSRHQRVLQVRSPANTIVFGDVASRARSSRTSVGAGSNKPKAASG